MAFNKTDEEYLREGIFVNPETGQRLISEGAKFNPETGQRIPEDWHYATSGNGDRSGPLTTDDPYKILKVSKGSTKQEIRTAFLAATQRYHPDKSKDPQATEKMQKVNAAYAKLSAGPARTPTPQRKPKYKSDRGPSSSETYTFLIGKVADLREYQAGFKDWLQEGLDEGISSPMLKGVFNVLGRAFYTEGQDSVSLQFLYREIGRDPNGVRKGEVLDALELLQDYGLIQFGHATRNRTVFEGPFYDNI